MSVQKSPVVLLQLSCVGCEMESGLVASMGCPARTVRCSLETPCMRVDTKKQRSAGIVNLPAMKAAKLKNGKNSKNLQLVTHCQLGYLA